MTIGYGVAIGMNKIIVLFWWSVLLTSHVSGISRHCLNKNINGLDSRKKYICFRCFTFFDDFMQ